MEKCKSCGKKIHEGHYMVEEMVCYCSECFSKEHTEEQIADLYDAGEQYWTEFE